MIQWIVRHYCCKHDRICPTSDELVFEEDRHSSISVKVDDLTNSSSFDFAQHSSIEEACKCDKCTLVPKLKSTPIKDNIASPELVTEISDLMMHSEAETDMMKRIRLFDSIVGILQHEIDEKQEDGNILQILRDQIKHNT